MSDYIFSNNDADQELRLIEKAYDMHSMRLLECTGVDRGWCCLELGPGAGSLLCWIADRVAESAIVLEIEYLNTGW